MVVGCRFTSVKLIRTIGSYLPHVSKVLLGRKGIRLGHSC